MDTEDFDAETVRAFISQGGNVDFQNKKGNSLLHQAILKKNVEIVKCLIEAGADVDLQNKSSKTALNIIVFENFDLETKRIVMKLLLEAGANVNIGKKDIYDGKTALHVAAEIGDVELVKLLIDRKSDVNAEDLYNWTALHWAAANVVSEDPTIFELLLSAGADVHSRTVFGKTPVRLLIENKQKISLCRIMKVFLKYEADFNAIDIVGQSPMDHAICTLNTEAAKALVLVGRVDVNSKISSPETNCCGHTILLEAFAVNHLPIVKFLLKNGANSNTLDAHNMSVLEFAVDCVMHDYVNDKNVERQMGLLNYLLKWYPDVNTITEEGYNILISPYENHKLPDFLWKTLVAHLAKLKSIDSPICESLLDTISSKLSYAKYFDKCNRELETAKTTKVHVDSWINFFNLLMDDKSKLVRYAGNVHLAKDLTEDRIVEKFPVYGKEIHEKFSKAMKKRFVRDQAAKKLSELLPVLVDPESSVVKKILSFFKVKDLNKILSADNHF